MNAPLAAPLPTAAYTDPDWFAREQRLLFAKVWTFAGLVEDFAPGAPPRAVTLGTERVLVYRKPDGQLRAVHDLCRHRGARLIRMTGGNKKRLVCPLHDWTYDLDGALIGVPDQRREFPDLDRGCHGLHRGAVGTWQGLVFVHAEADPPQTLAEWVAPLAGHLGAHDPADLPEWEEGRSTTEIRANWKIVAENFVDVYHLARLHSGTLAMVDHAKAEFGAAGPHVFITEPFVEEYARGIDKKSPLPLLPGLDRLRPMAHAPWVFPFLGLAATDGSWSVFALEPVAADRTRVHTRTRVAPVSAARFAMQAARSVGYWSTRVKPKLPDAPAGDPLGSADFMAEDVAACEALQQGMQSARFSVGGSARHTEAPVRHFQAQVRRWVEGPGETADPPPPDAR